MAAPDNSQIGGIGNRPNVGAGAFVAYNDQNDNNVINKKNELQTTDVWSFAAKHPYA